MVTFINKSTTDRYWKWGIIIILLISIFLRFWGIERFNSLVFDEVYYAKFANDYLTKTKFYNAHPPLSQYIIAIGIWIGDQLPIGRDVLNNDTGSLRSTFSYRWMNAIFGSLIPLVTAAIAYQLTKRWSYTFLACLFIALDGLYLVDSRYALNNVFLIFFGLLGQLFLLKSLPESGTKNWLYLILSGVSFGASAACKWNGLWFLLGIYFIIAIVWLIRALSQYKILPTNHYLLIHKITEIHPFKILVALAIIPLITYILLWIPHMIVNPEYGFDKNPFKGMWEMQTAILNYHEEVENGKKVHPYCANWYTWPLMLRPLAYYYVVKPIASGNVSREIIYDVHAMGNPLLWILAFGSILVFIYWLIRGTINKFYPDFSLSIAILGLTIPTIWFINLLEKDENIVSLNRLSWIPLIILGFGIILAIGELYWQSSSPSFNLLTTTIPLYITFNYLANLLPWIKVTRCVYIYHYMGAILFAILGLAWLVDQSLHSGEKWLKGTGITIIFFTIAAFIWWLPIYLGLPIDRQELAMRIGNFLLWNWI